MPQSCFHGGRRLPERTDRIIVSTSSELRVPPAVMLDFERIVAEVCDVAKLDYDERPLTTNELLGFLQECWREGVQRGLSTDDAKEDALERFGDLERVGKSFRRPWIKRIIYQKNYKAARYLMVLGVGLTNAFMAGLMASKMQTGDVNVAIYLLSLAMGFSLGPLYALIACLTIHIKFPKTPCWVQILWRGRYILFPIIVYGMIELLTGPFITYWLIAQNVSTDMVACILNMIDTALIPLNIIASFCLISEALNWADRKKKPILFHG